MKVIGFCSSYCEGRLVRTAVDSLLEVGLDRLDVFEGPAGPPLEPADAETFASDLAGYPDPGRPPVRGEPYENVNVFHGRWRTDGRKRNDWLQRAKAMYAGERDVWAVVVDADEFLGGARFLRDRLEWIGATDRARGATLADPDNPPMARWPLHLVEHDGSMSIITARVFRVDLLRSIDHSSSVVTNVGGIREGWGNYAEVSRTWIEGWLRAIDAGKMIAWPPLPCDTYLAHRSNLRPPGRRTLRMSEQEAAEFERAQAAELGGAGGDA